MSEELDGLFETLENDLLSKYQYNLLLNYITNLQQEIKEANDSVTWWTNRFNALQKENEKLKELCNKYEEEHNTAFKLWTMKMEEMPDYEEKQDYKSRNEKAVEYINNLRDESAERQGFYNCFPDDLYIADIDDLLNILQGGDE